MIFVDQDLDPLPARASAARSGLTARSVFGKHLQLPSQRKLAQFLRIAQAAVGLRGQVSVLLTTDPAMRRLNRRFRGVDKPTDVLSFPAPESASPAIAGDIAIGVARALRQAVEQRHSLSEEIKILILHGLLHLAGFDHETDEGHMASRERLLRAKLGLAEGLIERSDGDGLQKLRKGAGDEDKCQGTTSVVPKEPLISLPNRGLQPAKSQLSGRFPQPLQPVGKRSSLTAQVETRVPAKGSSGAEAHVDFVALPARLKRCPDSLCRPNGVLRRAVKPVPSPVPKPEEPRKPAELSGRSTPVRRSRKP